MRSAHCSASETPGLVSRNLPSEIAEFEFKLLRGALPAVMMLMRFSVEEEEAVKKHVHLLLEQGVIAPSYNEWVAGLMLSKNKDAGIWVT